MREVKLSFSKFMDNVSIKIEATFPCNSLESDMQSIQPHIDAIAAIVADAPINPPEDRPKPDSPSE